MTKERWFELAIEGGLTQEQAEDFFMDKPDSVELETYPEEQAKDDIQFAKELYEAFPYLVGYNR